MCLLGIICNYELTRLFTFNSYLGAGLRIQSSTSWPSVIYAVFHLFGYRTEVSLISLAGILSVLGIGCGIYLIIDSFYYLIHMNFETGWMLRLLFLFSFLTLTFILIFAYDTYYFLLYYIFPYSFIPVLIAEKSEYEPVTLPFLHTRVLVPFIVFLSLVGNGVFNTAWFADLPVQDQTYDGLNYYNRRIVSELSGAVSFLEERQYKWGCSPYWSSNIVTEMTNGAICVTPLEPWSSSKPHYYPWLTFLSYQDIEASPAFLLLSNEKSSMELFSGEIVYSDDYYTIVEYGTSKELWNLIQQ